MDDYPFMSDPSGCTFVEDDDSTTADGRALIAEIRKRASSLEGDFSMLYSQMDSYERLWRMEADRWEAPEDKQFNQYLPAFPSPEGRILGDKLVRANTKERVAFRATISAEWQQKKQDASQQLERYCEGAIWMADAERFVSRRGYWQHTAAWLLTVRGACATIAFVKASKRQSLTAADEYGTDSPFSLQTPDPRECVWDEDGDFFAHHNWRSHKAFAHVPGLEVNRTKAKEQQCDAINVWWRDAAGHVWNALVLENCFAIPPTDHTARRKMSHLPVIIDTAFGAPPEVVLNFSNNASLQNHYQGALEVNKNALYVTNTVNAYFMRGLRDSVVANLAIFTRGQVPSADQMRDFFRGRGLIALDPDDKVQYLQPPQVSDSIMRWQQSLDKWKQMGGLPDATGTGVPDGMSALFAAEVAHQGDAKAGPISEALKRSALCIGKEFLSQHLALRRQVKVAAQGAKGPFVLTFNAADLPKPGEYVLEATHRPYLVNDEYREAQTAATWRGAGMSALSVFDRWGKDPIEEEKRRLDELMKLDPGVQALDLAAHATRIGRADIAKYFTQKAMMMITPQGGPGGGQANAPRPQPMTDAAPMPLAEGAAAPPPASMGDMPMMDPTQPGAEAMLGAIGGQQGGFNAY